MVAATNLPFSLLFLSNWAISDLYGLGAINAQANEYMWGFPLEGDPC